MSWLPNIMGEARPGFAVSYGWNFIQVDPKPNLIATLILKISNKI
jgi:hypothetical protein